MEPVTAGLFVVVGLAVGLLSGLIGIGGGVLIVPFLYFFYDHPDLFGTLVAPEARVALAHGTSLFVIVPTSLRGAFTYHRSELVEWRAAWPIGISSVLAAFAGAHLAAVLPPEALKFGFGLLLIFSGTRIGLRGKRDHAAPPRPPRLSHAVTITAGVIIGVLSALLGVGGGTIAIPLLIYLVRLDVRQVAATSIGIIAFTATAGAIGYVVSGWNAPGLPGGTLGYVHLSAGIAMFLGALLSVRQGARLNQKMQPRTIELMFSALFVLLGVRLVGEPLIRWMASLAG